MGAIRRPGRSRRGWTFGGTAAAAAFPAQPGSLISRFDFSQAGTVTVVANKATVVTNLAGAGSNLAAGSTQPGYSLTTLNGLNTLDCSASGYMSGTIPAGVTNLTFQAVIKAGAAVSGAYGVAGTDVAGIVYQINAGVLRIVDYNGVLAVTFPDLTLIAGSAHVVTYRRSGTTADAFLDGTKTVNPGAVTAVAINTPWLLGTDDPGNFDPFTGFFGETLFYNTALSDVDILTNQAALKAKWGTP